LRRVRSGGIRGNHAAAKQSFTAADADIDRLPWDAELFTEVPKFVDGCFVVPDRLGWGCETREEALKAHPLNPTGGLMSYRQNS
jgi:L-alanine-DL-glutamate epimerase-like enolase superfamily enzyme